MVAIADVITLGLILLLYRMTAKGVMQQATASQETQVCAD